MKVSEDEVAGYVLSDFGDFPTDVLEWLGWEHDKYSKNWVTVDRSVAFKTLDCFGEVENNTGLKRY